MTTMIACLVATISTLAFLMLWFWVVKRELRVKKSTVKSAEIQLAACHKKYMQSSNDIEKQDAQCVIDRSLDIYRQSVDIYNKTLQKPWNHIPGYLMGFKRIE